MVNVKTVSTSGTQYTVLEIQFRSLKYMIVSRIHKNFEQLSIPIHAIQGEIVLMQKTHFKQLSNMFLLYILTKIV